MSEPRWLVEARKHVGLKEIAGRQHNPAILRWWTLIRAPFADDETPWCAGFVGGILESVGIKSSRSASARSYSRWGQPLRKPILGCVVVFWRGSPTSYTGHVGFVVGTDANDNLMVLGGNQGDAVNIKPFDRARALDFRWPLDEPITGDPLPRLTSSGKVSTNEG